MILDPKKLFCAHTNIIKKLTLMFKAMLFLVIFLLSDKIICKVLQY